MNIINILQQLFMIKHSIA